MAAWRSRKYVPVPPTIRIMCACASPLGPSADEWLVQMGVVLGDLGGGPDTPIGDDHRDQLGRSDVEGRVEAFRSLGSYTRTVEEEYFGRIAELDRDCCAVGRSRIGAVVPEHEERDAVPLRQDRVL